jgi:hypothetical protein
MQTRGTALQVFPHFTIKEQVEYASCLIKLFYFVLKSSLQRESVSNISSSGLSQNVLALLNVILPLMAGKPVEKIFPMVLRMMSHPPDILQLTLYV